MTDTAGLQPYEQPPKPRKSRKVYWIVGGLVLAAILLGTCVSGGIKAFKAVSERSDATHALVQQFLSDGLPAATDPVYSRRIEITQKAVDDTNRYIRLYGKVTEVSAPTCGMRTAAHTDPSKTGTFSDCVMTVSSERSPGQASVQWVKEDQTWKVMGFNVAYSDQSVLLDKAEQADALLAEGAEQAAEAQTDPAAEN